jgi:hypothetical protein
MFDGQIPYQSAKSNFTCIQNGNKGLYIRKSMQFTSWTQNLKLSFRNSSLLIISLKLNLHFVLTDDMVFDKNHKHIHNEEKILHRDEYHLIYLRNTHWINVLIYHIHSLVEFPHYEKRKRISWKIFFIHNGIHCL